MKKIVIGLMLMASMAVNAQGLQIIYQGVWLFPPGQTVATFNIPDAKAGDFLTIQIDSVDNRLTEANIRILGSTIISQPNQIMVVLSNSWNWGPGLPLRYQITRTTP